jgi:hypothetical protein
VEAISGDVISSVRGLKGEVGDVPDSLGVLFMVDGDMCVLIWRVVLVSCAAGLLCDA